MSIGSLASDLQEETTNSLGRKTLSLRQKEYMTTLVSTCYRTWLSLDSKRWQMTIVCLHVSTSSLASGWLRGDCNSLGQKTLSLRQKEQMITLVSACYWTWLSLDSKRWQMAVVCLSVSMGSLASSWQRGYYNSLGRKTLSLWQKEQMTTLVSACYRTWLSLDSKRWRMTIVCLHVSIGSLASGLQRGDFNSRRKA